MFALNIIMCHSARRSDDSHDGVLLTPRWAENVPDPDLDNEDCEETLLIELYNMADNETDSIDRFTPVALGELKMNLSDIWLAGCCSQRAFGCVNSDFHESVEMADGSRESFSLPDAQTCDAVPEIQLCTIIDRWFGGMVSPPWREGSPEDGFEVAVRLECRQFERHGRCGVERYGVSRNRITDVTNSRSICVYLPFQIYLFASVR